jgi:hypothetical protein
LALALFLIFVDTFVAVTDALGTTEPEASVTLPVILQKWFENTPFRKTREERQSWK